MFMEHVAGYRALGDEQRLLHLALTVTDVTFIGPPRNVLRAPAFPDVLPQLVVVSEHLVATFARNSLLRMCRYHVVSQSGTSLVPIGADRAGKLPLRLPIPFVCALFDVFADFGRGHEELAAVRAGTVG